MSKGLQALNGLKDVLAYFGAHTEKAIENCNIIEKELKDKEQLEKAFDTLSKENEKVMKELSKQIEKNRILEIIKEKGVNVGYFIFRLVHNDLSYEEYIEEQETPYLDIYVSRKKLTKEEYDLLKEVLL